MSDSIVFIDDDADVVLSLTRACKSRLPQFSFHAACNSSEAIKICKRENPLAIVLDLCLDDSSGPSSGIELLQQLQDIDPSCRVLVLTGHDSVSNGVACIERGAANFLTKPASIEHLIVLLEDAASQCILRRATLQAKQHTKDALSYHFVGSSEAIRQVHDQIAFAAYSDQPVLILGETGTGKGLCARLIHAHSSRSAAAFVRYQPTVLAPEMIISELFGHQRGAFTGAQADRNGLLLDAQHGSVFLDEIDELPPQAQVLLLGALQEQRFRPLGSNREVHSDFRLIAACNKPVFDLLEREKIRRDFYHRLAHLTIEIPPLRERRSDIATLVMHTLEQYRDRKNMPHCSIAPAALALLCEQNWPGNVRELQATTEAAAQRMYFRNGRTIELCDLSSSANGLPDPSAPTLREQVQVYKQRLVRRALVETGGNQIQAAATLGIDRSTLRRIISA